MQGDAAFQKDGLHSQRDALVKYKLGIRYHRTSQPVVNHAHACSSTNKSSFSKKTVDFGTGLSRQTEEKNSCFLRAFSIVGSILLRSTNLVCARVCKNNRTTHAEKHRTRET